MRTNRAHRTTIMLPLELAEAVQRRVWVGLGALVGAVVALILLLR